MIKKTVNYENFDGDKVVEDVYFNLTKTELIDMALDLPDGFSESVETKPEELAGAETVKRIVKKIGEKGLVQFIKDIVLKSYGVKSKDGNRFIKEDENGRPLYREFQQTLAYETIMEELRSDDLAAAEFINGVIPSSVADKMPNVKKLMESSKSDK